MLEGLAVWVLNNYLGKYVENLNTDQLSIALLSGKVELENLPLKKDALRHLGLPITVKAGFIGKVKLQIPVRQIRSAPWVIVMEQLYVVASPFADSEWDAESEELSRQEFKLASLDTLEARWRLEIDAKDTNATYASSYSSWLSFGTGLVSDIIENLQLKIQDVHIRYEDSASISGKSIAFGVAIESLAAQSCDANWSPGFSNWAKSGESFKLLDLQKFSIYWITCEEDQLFSNLNLGDLAVAMSSIHSSKSPTNYILPPVGAQAHLKRNLSEKPLRSTDTPRIVCDLILEEVPITLVDWQYNQMVHCVRNLDDIARLRNYRQFRPPCSVKDDAKAWWLYAISCFYPGRQPNICRPKPTWETCLRRARENVQYVQLYKKILITPTIALTPDEKKVKDVVEWNRSFDELKILRELAMKTVKLPDRQLNNASTGRSMLESWFPQWMGWYSNSGSSEVKNEMQSQLEGEILQVLTDSVENNTILKRDAVFGKFNFSLKRGSINLCALDETTNDSAPMLELEFKNLSLTIESRPRTSSHLVELALGAVYLKDKITLNTVFPIIMGPPGMERTATGRMRGPSPRMSLSSSKFEEIDLFSLSYEKKPPNSGCDYRLCVRSKCLDVIYQPNAVRWLTEFLCLPHQRNITQSKIEAMKSRTKKELIKNWEHILDGRAAVRTSWELELDISAPQIFFVEQFSDQNSAMAVIDLGRLKVSNKSSRDIQPPTRAEFTTKESEEDDETFLTPCSTPPQSEASESENATEPPSQIENLPIDDTLSELTLHRKLYDSYNLELTDIQILIGKVKDNWRYAHNKGTSTLHVLDRFNIILQIERRVIHTSDPHYPSLTVCAKLPKLVAHINEHKIISARNLAHIISATGLPSPFKSPETSVEEDVKFADDEDGSSSLDTSIEMSRLLTMEFTVDQMSLEVQSRGRCVAELQVAGVKVAFTKRMLDMSITLTVHSLLLVDALQTFGPDFELLVASHKHVGMDSMSGSLRDSEPTSPTSPASPDPTTMPRPTSPVALTQALTSLATSPPLNYKTGGDNSLVGKQSALLDAEALISIEVILITGAEAMQIANIQFNNLDIIANQETIVELVGFVRRVFPKSQKPMGINLHSVVSSSVRESTESLLDDNSHASKIASTELTFDFHRLNVLLLRGVVNDGILCGKKICTATMSEAKIQATVGSKLEVEGSLGGLQVLDLTPEGQMHQRIVSVGRDPLVENQHPLYMMSSFHEDSKPAFSFKIVRNLERNLEKDSADITVRMASLWYTHSPRFVVELQSCATEFKTYLSNLARSIRSAATDMALGLVHARAEALAQTLYMNSRLSSSIYGSSLSFSESASPRRRRRSSSMEASGYCSARETIPQTPYSPEDDDDFIIDIKLDIELESPVAVLPRASNSTQVFVAHLGKITISNKESFENNLHSDNLECMDLKYKYSDIERYDIEVKDMNLFSLDTFNRRGQAKSSTTKPEVLYSCETLAKPILHDTILQLHIEREINKNMPTIHSSESTLLLDGNEENFSYTNKESFQVTGSVVTALKVSLTRAQYEQLLDSLQWLTSSPVLNESRAYNFNRPPPPLADISEEDTGVTTLNMDPHVRAKLFPSISPSNKSKPADNKSQISLKIDFDLPTFIIELRGDSPLGEQALVDLTLREFVFNYEKCHKFETNIQVSLRSIFMEDLMQVEGSKQRAMVVSSSGEDVPIGASCTSRSCPDTVILPSSYYNSYHASHGSSLPDHLETAKVFGIGSAVNTNLPNIPDGECPCTPPPSPSQRQRPEQNLVLISTLIVDPEAPNFESDYNSTARATSVQFNCLDLVVSVESWVLVIDFFSASPSSSISTSTASLNSLLADDSKIDNSKEKSELNLTVRSLTIVLVKPELDIAKANISNVNVVVKTVGLSKEVDGKLGSMSLLDLTLHGQLYKERFITSGKQALQFKYVRFQPNSGKNFDAQLTLDMASVTYVHTKRYIAEIQSFFEHFSQLQSVMRGIRAATSGQLIRDEPLKLSLILQAVSPIILLPVSSKSFDLLIVDLGQLLVRNSFKIVSDESENSRCLLDVMTIELENMDLYTGSKENEFRKNQVINGDLLKFGGSIVSKKGPSLLTKKIELKLRVERNLHSNTCHLVPDMMIYGELSTLDGTLDASQYKLIRGLLAYNLGENTDSISQGKPQEAVQDANCENGEVWTTFSLKLDLLNVCLRLVQTHGKPSNLTCINFIKSHLTVETFSNSSEDIDLVSQEILIMDTRFNEPSSSKASNVFTKILQPISYSKESESVQAEIHSRKRQDKTKFTILLNDMRLMAIFDWWIAFKEYIFQEIQNVQSSPEHKNNNVNVDQSEQKRELKLNITDSEIVFVEDAACFDTNAVILKSTTVVTYYPQKNVDKPLSFSLNNCEMFSCILGQENETALSIIDPVTLNMDINKDNVLEAQLHFLTVRLSYHDMRMFLQMLNSLPKQMFTENQAQHSNITKNQIANLVSLGFRQEDCLVALEKTDYKLDDAALWLTNHATLVTPSGSPESEKPLSISAVDIKANCVSICIIDDCGDSDVPLLELSFSELNLNQSLPEFTIGDVDNQPKGSLRCILASDYYNRVLSGWEPIIEPWNCRIYWEKSLGKSLQKNRLNVEIISYKVLNVNITSTLMELYKQVKENWTSDYYSVKENGTSQNKWPSSPGFRRRSPFVPFALKNETGSPICFTTLISDMDNHLKPLDFKGVNWIEVAPGDTIPFSFSTRDKIRHQDSHKMKMHQLAVKVDGWQPVLPVTVDKVGVYFRVAQPHIHRMQEELRPARIVFDVALEGSARKLVTIRSALQIFNKLSHPVEIKLESSLPHDSETLWVPPKTFAIKPDDVLAVPLVHAYSQLNLRPTGLSYQYTFCSPTISWMQMPNAAVVHELRTCHTHKGHNYRFCAEIRKEKPCLERNERNDQPAHRITLLPTVKLVNLLPIDLNYNLSGERGRISAGANANLTSVDPEKAIELDVMLENFINTNPLLIPPNCSSENSCRIRLEDIRGRKLLLNGLITPYKGARLKITVSAPYWIINRTGLPLVFRQSGASSEGAGQFDEHEVARMVAPLLFSFSDQDASPMINARVGNRVIRDGIPQWCSNFHVQKGTYVRKLYISMREGRPDTVFVVGVEVRPGRGKYRSTHIVTISPRYQLYNRSSYQLLFKQYNGKNDEKSQKSHLSAMPNSHMPFHWSRIEKQQLLCVSIVDIQNCCWSGGLPIDTDNSMHVNVRDQLGRVYFLRLEVILQGSTVFIIFTDADTMPPPMRVDNFSEVSIKFGQTCCKDVLSSTARAHSSVPYAWDQPTQTHAITLVAPGGVSHSYDMNRLGLSHQLTYENFIYIAFTETFAKSHQAVSNPLDIESQELVLDIGKNNQVILARKVAGERSQLWRMTGEGQLEHEGSSPPVHPHQLPSNNKLVLDIENTAPQPNTYCRLMLRRKDPRRRSTQTWRFTEEGRLCCAHSNMCVQAQDGFFGLRQGNSAVLGLPQPVCHKVTDKGIPIEQAICKQRFRPGSGMLSVEIHMDGPTRVISIKDEKLRSTYATFDEREWGSISQNQRPNLTLSNSDEEELKDSRELQFTVKLHELGISLVCRKAPEELLYAVFSNIVGETVITPKRKRFCISVENIQVDNQLFEASVPVVLYVTPRSLRNADENHDRLPAIDFTAELQQQLNENAVIFSYLILRLKKMTIIIEELLFLKLFDFVGYHSQTEELISRDETDYETQQLLTKVSATHAKRYYFGVIKLIPDQIRLSVKTANKIPAHLQRIKRKLGITLIKFENAAVDLEAFQKLHPFETLQFLLNSILNHFKEELFWQAGMILGSIDFIGNPLGLVNDVSEGVSGLIYEGNVGALVKNVTHGLSNSAVKFTESLSDGLGRVAMDDSHEDMRQKIRQVESGSSKDHIVAGFKGLGFGFLGGATGIFKQVYEGASNDGIQGVFSGLGKGLVGVVTKPMVGVLDFASETARAVRDSSKSKLIPERTRPPRCIHGPGGLLPRYSLNQSQGQQYLYIVNDKNYDEHLIAYQILGSASEDLQCIISNQYVRIVTSTRIPDPTPIIECHLSNLEVCNVVTSKEGGETRYYIEIVMHVAGTSAAALVNPDPVRKPCVRCRTIELAHTVSLQINYAKRLYTERQFTLSIDNISNNDD